MGCHSGLTCTIELTTAVERDEFTMLILPDEVKIPDETLDLYAKRICKFRGRCLRCKRNFPLEWAHIISRGYHMIRWDLQNCMCLCHFCHYYFTNHPAEFDLFVRAKIGDELYWELRRRASNYSKGARPDREATLRFLKVEWSRIQAIPQYNHAVEYLGIKRVDL